MTHFGANFKDTVAFSPARPDTFARYEQPLRQARLLRWIAALLFIVALLATLAATALSLRPLQIIVLPEAATSAPQLLTPTMNAPADAGQAARFVEHLLQQPSDGGLDGRAQQAAWAAWRPLVIAQRAPDIVPPVVQPGTGTQRYFLGVQGPLKAHCIADTRPHVWMCVCHTLMVDVTDQFGAHQASAKVTALLALVVRAPRTQANVWGLHLLDLSTKEEMTLASAPEEQLP